MSSDHYEGLVTRLEFCAQMKIDPRQARRWAMDGYGPKPRRIGMGHGRVYYVQAEIDAFIANAKNTPSVVA